mgnify:CR=1 FL=1
MSVNSIFILYFFWLYFIKSAFVITFCLKTGSGLDILLFELLLLLCFVLFLLFVLVVLYEEEILLVLLVLVLVLVRRIHGNMRFSVVLVLVLVLLDCVLLLLCNVFLMTGHALFNRVAGLWKDNIIVELLIWFGLVWVWYVLIS